MAYNIKLRVLRFHGIIISIEEQNPKAVIKDENELIFIQEHIVPQNKV